MRDDSTQALLYPRQQIWDRHGRRIDDDTIPNVLKNAQMEMALLAQNGTDLYPEGDTSNDITQRAVAIGEISDSKTFQGTNKEQATYAGFREIELILYPILMPESRPMRFAL